MRWSVGWEGWKEARNDDHGSRLILPFVPCLLFLLLLVVLSPRVTGLTAAATAAAALGGIDCCSLVGVASHPPQMANEASKPASYIIARLVSKRAPQINANERKTYYFVFHYCNYDFFT